jgi:hypothetical protein
VGIPFACPIGSASRRSSRPANAGPPLQPTLGRHYLPRAVPVRNADDPIALERPGCPWRCPTASRPRGASRASPARSHTVYPPKVLPGLIVEDRKFHSDPRSVRFAVEHDVSRLATKLDRHRDQPRQALSGSGREKLEPGTKWRDVKNATAPRRFIIRVVESVEAEPIGRLSRDRSSSWLRHRSTTVLSIAMPSPVRHRLQSELTT